jgi:hypothetical protein
MIGQEDLLKMNNNSTIVAFLGQKNSIIGHSHECVWFEYNRIGWIKYND